MAENDRDGALPGWHVWRALAAGGAHDETLAARWRGEIDAVGAALVRQARKVACGRDRWGEELGFSAARIALLETAGYWSQSRIAARTARWYLAETRRIAGRALYEQMASAVPLADALQYRASLGFEVSALTLWREVMTCFTPRVVRRMGGDIYARIRAGSFRSWPDVEAWSRVYRKRIEWLDRMPAAERSLRGVSLTEARRRVARYERGVLRHGELMQLLSILLRQPRAGEANRSDAALLDVAILPPVLQREVTQTLAKVPAEWRGAVLRLLQDLWANGGRGLAWNRVVRWIGQGQMGESELVIVHDGPDGAVAMIPRGARMPRSSAILGDGTSWCTRACSIWFDRYVSRGPLFVLLLPDGTRTQLHLPTLQWCDDLNTRISVAEADRFAALASAWCPVFSLRETVDWTGLLSGPRYAEMATGVATTLAALVKARLIAPVPSECVRFLFEHVTVSSLAVPELLEQAALLATQGAIIPPVFIRRCILALASARIAPTADVLAQLEALERRGSGVTAALADSIEAAHLWQRLSAPDAVAMARAQAIIGGAGMDVARIGAAEAQTDLGIVLADRLTGDLIQGPA